MTNNHLRKKQIIGLCMALIVMCMAIVSMLAVTSLSASAAGRKKVRLGYMWGYHFQEGASEGAAKSGFSYEYLQQVAAYSNWDYEYVYGTWEECYEMLLKGEIDVMSGISYTPERAEYISFPDLPITTETYHIFVWAKDEADYPNIGALHGKRVGVSGDTLTADSLKKWEELNHYGIQIIAYPDDDTRMNAFRNGETDATADLAMQVSGDSGMVPVLQFGVDNTYIAVAKGRNDLLQDLNEAVSTINATLPNFQSNLFQKYFSEISVLSTLTAEDIAWFAGHPTIRVGYLESLAPFVEKGPNGQPRGMYVDLIQYSLNRMDQHNEVEYFAYKDIDEMTTDLQNGVLDIAGPVYGTMWAAEQKDIVQTIEVVSSQMHLVSKKDEEIQYGTVFAVPDEVPGEVAYLDAHYPGHELVHYPTVRDVIRAVQNGEADAAVLSNYMISIYMRNNDKLYQRRLPYEAEFSIAVNSDAKVLLSVLNRGISSWGISNIQESVLRHTDEAYIPTVEDFIKANYQLFILGMTAGVIVLTILVMLVIFRSRQKRTADRNAHVDNMTGLLNRRAYEEDVDKLAQKPLPDDLVVCVMDINGLKSANDSLGHEAGDELICGLSDCLKAMGSVPEFKNIKMNAYRTGGDEFITIGQFDDEMQRKIRNKLEAQIALWHGEKIKNLSVSVGRVRRSEYRDASITELLRIADNRMYMRKKEMHKEVLTKQDGGPRFESLIRTDVNREDADMLATVMKVFESEFDRMTGLPGMSYFVQAVPFLSKEIEAHGGETTVVCLKLADLNQFNEARGVQAGNDLISEFASILVKTFGKKNCARAGGNEMFICTAHQTLEERLNELFDGMKHSDIGRDAVILAGISTIELGSEEPIANYCNKARMACTSQGDAKQSQYRY